MDNSLDLIELEKAYKRICRKKFAFQDKSENEYTLAVINVKFNYTYKPVKIKELREHFYENGFYFVPWTYSVNGTNATLFGNGPELLKYIAGEEVTSELKKGQIYSKRFVNGAKLLCACSPHITMGNLYCVEKCKKISTMRKPNLKERFPIWKVL